MRAKASKHVYRRVGKLNVDLQQGADRLVLAYHSKTWDVSVQMVLNGEEARELSRALAECADALGPGTTLDRELDRMLDDAMRKSLVPGAVDFITTPHWADAGGPLGPGLDPDAPTELVNEGKILSCPRCPVFTHVTGGPDGFFCGRCGAPV